MHLEVLSDEQQALLPLMKKFKRDYYLVGGTALALQIGHRESIDYDLFTGEDLKTNQILSKLDRSKIQKVTVDSAEQYSIVYNDVNLTFLHYPFSVEPDIEIGDNFRSVDPLTIGSMKAYALGRRAKWKDYVDLYFILQMHTIEELLENTRKIYGKLFNDRLFLQQLCYFEDINHTEKVSYLPRQEISDETVQEKLIEIVKRI
ncbi:hypothetical protein GF389_05775 [Candidatus Dojkabacteria bacterium]|nr:hypothetical protein [Candidatus Dojkabacteria bacterium]